MDFKRRGPAPCSTCHHPDPETHPKCALCTLLAGPGHVAASLVELVTLSGSKKMVCPSCSESYARRVALFAKSYGRSIGQMRRRGRSLSEISSLLGLDTQQVIWYVKERGLNKRGVI